MRFLCQESSGGELLGDKGGKRTVDANLLGFRYGDHSGQHASARGRNRRANGPAPTLYRKERFMQAKCANCLCGAVVHLNRC